MMQWQKAKARQALMDAHRRKEDADPHTQADREVYRLYMLKVETRSR